MLIKICRGNYVQDTSCEAKFHYGPIREFCPYAKLPTEVAYSAIFGVLKIRYPQGRCADFDVRCVKRRRFEHVLVGAPKTKFYILSF